VPALPPYIIEPIWQQFKALLPEREVDHPLGCHRPRIPDRVVFEKLVQVLVFGCASRCIADDSCSATTLRRRREEWIEEGVMGELEGMAFEAYDRTIGLELSEVAVDCCTTKAPCGGEKAGRSPVERGKRGIKRSVAVDARGIPLGVVSAPANRHDSPLLGETLDAARASGLLPEGASIRLDRGYDSEATRQRLRVRDLLAEISVKGKPAPPERNRTMDRRTHELLAKRPQEARVVHGTTSASGRLLDGFLERGDHRRTPRPRGLEALSLGRPTPTPTMTYWRKLLVRSAPHRVAPFRVASLRSALVRSTLRRSAWTR
jgi:transposase